MNKKKIGIRKFTIHIWICELKVQTYGNYMNDGPKEEDRNNRQETV